MEWLEGLTGVMYSSLYKSLLIKQHVALKKDSLTSKDMGISYSSYYTRAM